MKVALRKRSLKEIRKEHLVPGVIYGKSVESTPIEVDEKVLLETLKTYGKNMTFDVSIGRKKHQAYIKHIQSEVLKPNHVIHFELHALAKDETIHASIPVVLIGKEVLENDRLFIQFNTPNIDCEYAPGLAVTHFEFDVSKLKSGDQLHISDLVIPKGITVHHKQDLVILSVKDGVMMEDVDQEKEVESKEVAEESSKV
jgi:large subunit ribosomal protein L25